MATEYEIDRLSLPVEYLYEAGVQYRHLSNDEIAKPGEITHRYRWRHLFSGISGERRIVVIGGCLSDLLLYWNNGAWLYKPA